MKTKIIGLILLSFLMVSCVSIPKETVTLSKTIGEDLQILHSSHRNIVQLYYHGIKSNINTFIDEVYAPFVINYVLESELSKFKNGEPSLYSIIAKTGKDGKTDELEEALSVMLEFQEAANNQITLKRNELLSPILFQEMKILTAIDQSYQNTIYANTTLTAFLNSTYSVKKSQGEVLNIIGLEGMDRTITNKLVELSSSIENALQVGEEIDIKSDEASKQIEDIIRIFKGLTK